MEWLKLEEFPMDKHERKWTNWTRSRVAIERFLKMVPYHFIHHVQNLHMENSLVESYTLFSATRKIDWVLADLLEATLSQLFPGKELGKSFPGKDL